jgi:hypothetical protein
MYTSSVYKYSSPPLLVVTNLGQQRAVLVSLLYLCSSHFKTHVCLCLLKGQHVILYMYVISHLHTI